METQAPTTPDTDQKDAPPVTLESLRIATQKIHQATLLEINELVLERELVNAKIRELRVEEAEQFRACKALDKGYGKSNA